MPKKKVWQQAGDYPPAKGAEHGQGNEKQIGRNDHRDKPIAPGDKQACQTGAQSAADVLAALCAIVQAASRLVGSAAEQMRHQCQEQIHTKKQQSDACNLLQSDKVCRCKPVQKPFAGTALFACSRFGRRLGAVRLARIFFAPASRCFTRLSAGHNWLKTGRIALIYASQCLRTRTG